MFFKTGGGIFVKYKITKKKIMKLLYKPILCAAFCIAMQNCSIVTTIYHNTDKKQTRIVLNDGSEIEGKTVLPKNAQKKVRVTTPDGQKIKLLSTDIATMCLYKEKYPENQSFFQYMPYDIWRNKKKEWYEMGSRWMPVEAVGDNIAVFTLGDWYQMSAKGELSVFCRGGSILYIVRKADDTSGKCVGSYMNKSRFYKKDLMEYLSDDADLCRMIEEGDIEDGDFQAIAEEYAPEKQ